MANTPATPAQANFLIKLSEAREAQNAETLRIWQTPLKDDVFTVEKYVAESNRPKYQALLTTMKVASSGRVAKVEELEALGFATIFNRKKNRRGGVVAEYTYTTEGITKEAASILIDLLK